MPRRARPAHVEGDLLGELEHLPVEEGEAGEAAPLALAAVERGAMPDRDERVLQLGPPRVVRVDVAGGDGRDAERGREVAQMRVPAGIAALERSLQLDVEAVAAEGVGDPDGGV